jgi:hypothetical protein
MPPLPIPWIARPAIKVPPLLAPPQMALPTVKVTTIDIASHLRPNIFATWPKNGWTAALEIYKYLVRYI